ncbi:MAG: hypothetical protein J5517_01720 [Eubacterium sp.]|nr:hypothetical protein [Eubacterium sp.]
MENLNMDDLNLDDLIENSSEIENLSVPNIKPTRNTPVSNEPEWQASSLQKSFWNYNYENSTAADSFKKNSLKRKLIIAIPCIIAAICIIAAAIHFISVPKTIIDVTNMACDNESQLSGKLGLSFRNSDVYTAKVRVLSDELVQAKAAEGFSVYYINGTQEGIFFDSKKYSLYGLKVDDICDENFSNTTFKYNETYGEIVDYHAGKKYNYYLYNTATNECMIVTYDTVKKTIIELGYFYDYKEIIKRFI